MKNLFKTLYKYWMKFANLLGTINGFIILTIFYFFVVGLYFIPTFLIGGFTKKPWLTTYWKNKGVRESNLDNLKLQF